jgi:hypothetical protein
MFLILVKAGDRPSYRVFKITHVQSVIKAWNCKNLVLAEAASSVTGFNT